MSSPRPEEAIVDAALEKPRADRVAYLDEACATNPRLRQLAGALLRAHEHAPAFHKPFPTDRSPRPSAISEKPGDRIGRYKLLQQIGEGGCGVVYLAEQQEPVRRQVALKVIKLGMDTKQVIARFGAERQALALMDHPNIAKVLDAGATETGRPYFIMELVRGAKITDYCDQNTLSIPDRLQLFIQICRAIQHAHQKGLIHRDIKPSNILVSLHDGVPVPKIIDFGIAKATEQRLTDKTVFTVFQQFIGTPAYMSPEQAEMSSLDIDTRSDIYSLGVLLYELLTGQTPFFPQDLSAAGFEEMRRVIREKEPVRPSVRLNSLEVPECNRVAMLRQIEPAKLASLVRGDLDWIVMCGLEKDRARRYETSNALALDVQRHLDNEPVVACPPSTAYRFQKLVSRNKLAFTFTTAVAITIIAGLTVSTWLFVKERRAHQIVSHAEQEQKRARDDAKAEAARSQQVAQFLKEMLQTTGPFPASGRETKTLRESLDTTAERALSRDTRILREMLDKAALRLRVGLKDHPEAEAELRNVIGRVYRQIGQQEQAETMHRQALDLYRKVLGEQSLEVADSLSLLASAMLKRGKYSDAETAIHAALAIRTKLLGSEHPTTAQSLHDLAYALYWQWNLAESESLNRQAIAINQKLLGRENLAAAASLNNLALVLRDQDKFAQAESALHDALEMEKHLLGSQSAEVAVMLHNLAVVLERQDNPAKLLEAEGAQRQSLDIRKQLFGNSHPEVHLSIVHLGALLRELGQLSAAETLYRETLAIYRHRFGTEDRFVARLLYDLSTVLIRQERLEEAEAITREGLALRRKLSGPGPANSLDRLATIILQRQGNLAEAEELALESLPIRERDGPDDWETWKCKSLLGAIFLRQKRFSEAEPLLLSGFEGMQQRVERKSVEYRPLLREGLQRLVELYQVTGCSENAAQWKKKLAALDQAYSHKKVAAARP